MTMSDAKRITCDAMGCDKETVICSGDRDEIKELQEKGWLFVTTKSTTIHICPKCIHLPVFGNMHIDFDYIASATGRPAYERKDRK